MNKKNYQQPKTKLYEFREPLMFNEQSQTGASTPPDPSGGSGEDLSKRRGLFDEEEDYEQKSVLW